jgi:putative mRNA 3-end processing factor
MPLISFTSNGFFCEQGNFYIDPWRPVANALITHAHSDHARWGHQLYVAQQYNVPILKARLGANINVEGIAFYETIYKNGVAVTFYPAGHIIGSAQIKIEYKGEVWVISGDYKLENDNFSGAFEPIKCNYFISECTFGLPIYNWQPQEIIYDEISNWVHQAWQQDKTPLIFAYSLGKAQRLIHNLIYTVPKIYVHTAVANMNEAIIKAGINLPNTLPWHAGLTKEDMQHALFIAPQSVQDSKQALKLNNVTTATCSGWMMLRGAMRRGNIDKGFALSDHADWPNLLKAIKATNCEKVFVTHGFTGVFSAYLNEQNIASEIVTTQFGNEQEEEAEVVN